MPEPHPVIRKKLELLNARYPIPAHLRPELEAEFLKHHLAGASERELMGEVFNVNLAVHFDQKERRLMAQLPDAFHAEDPLASEKMKKATLQQFYADCDKAANDAKVPIKAINELHRRIVEGGNEEQLHVALFPIYVRLREMGYNHHDLWT